MLSNTPSKNSTIVDQYAGYHAAKQFGQIDHTLDTYPLAPKTKDCYYKIKFPKTIFSALRCSPDEFVQQMRLAAAVKWYELQMVSQAKAAEIAGISRYAFLEALSKFNVSPFQVTADELLEEIARD
jgi:predicted HTH domain antitoxin